jgi:hypothetical protein
MNSTVQPSPMVNAAVPLLLYSQRIILVGEAEFALSAIVRCHGENEFLQRA